MFIKERAFIQLLLFVKATANDVHEGNSVPQAVVVHEGSSK